MESVDVTQLLEWRQIVAEATDGIDGGLSNISQTHSTEQVQGVVS